MSAWENAITNHPDYDKYQHLRQRYTSGMGMKKNPTFSSKTHFQNEHAHGFYYDNN